jgi:hypothetical protein
MHKFKIPAYIFITLIFTSLGFTETNDVKKLPSESDIFTIAFNVTGLKKESKDIVSRDELRLNLSNSLNLGRFNAQLKFPLDEHYWCQDGVVVLKNKSVFSFTIYEEMNETSPEIYMIVYFGDGKGTYLYKLQK